MAADKHMVTMQSMHLFWQITSAKLRKQHAQETVHMSEDKGLGETTKETAQSLNLAGRKTNATMSIQKIYR